MVLRQQHVETHKPRFRCIHSDCGFGLVFDSRAKLKRHHERYHVKDSASSIPPTLTASNAPTGESTFNDPMQGGSDLLDNFNFEEFLDNNAFQLDLRDVDMDMMEPTVAQEVDMDVMEPTVAQNEGDGLDAQRIKDGIANGAVIDKHGNLLEDRLKALEAPARTNTPETTRHWSVPEKIDFINLLKYYGTDWPSIAQEMRTKSPTMVNTTRYTKFP